MFATVTRVTGRNNIRDCMQAAFTQGLNVVHRQPAYLTPAIDTPIAIGSLNFLPLGNCQIIERRRIFSFAIDAQMFGHMCTMCRTIFTGKSFLFFSIFSVMTSAFCSHFFRIRLCPITIFCTQLFSMCFSIYPISFKAFCAFVWIVFESLLSCTSASDTL